MRDTILFVQCAHTPQEVIHRELFGCIHGIMCCNLRFDMMNLDAAHAKEEKPV